MSSIVKLGKLSMKSEDRQNQFMATEVRTVVVWGWGTDWEGAPGTSQVVEMCGLDGAMATWL